MNFIEEVKLNSIEKLMGRTFQDQKGIFAGRHNDFFYFIESNEKIKKINWNSAIKRKGLFKLPTQDQLKFLYSNKKEFNMNCSENEKWSNDFYWTSEDYKNYAYQIHFFNGAVYLKNKSDEFFMRGIYSLSVYKS